MKSSQAKVLVVDYQEDVLIEIERLLQNQGFETNTFWSGREALRAAETDHFDLVLVSDYLPDIAVDEFIRTLGTAVPCIVMYPGRSNGDFQHLRSAGAIELVCRLPLQTVVQVVRAQAQPRQPGTHRMEQSAGAA